MKKQLLSLFLTLAGACAASGCARNAYLDVTVNLPNPGTVVKTGASSQFAAMGAAIMVRRLSGPVGELESYVFQQDEGVSNIELGPSWDPKKSVISVEATGNFEDPLYVFVRLCASSTDCGGTSSNNTQRTFAWKIDHPHYKAQRTSVTLPIPGGDGQFPDITNQLPGIHGMYGCVLDDWAYITSQVPTASDGAVEINRCLVACPDVNTTRDWGCEDISMLAANNGMCIADFSSYKHACE